MKKIASLLFASLFTFIGFAQYCTTGGPTSTIDSNVELVQLTGASGSINFTGCPGVMGVQNLTATQSTTLSAGNNYTLSVKFGTCGGNFSGVGEAWIDYNLDGVFDPTESIGTWSGIPPSPITNFNFTVPINAQTGNSRLRVMQREAGTLPLDPCGSFTWGSVMDFGIIITGGVDCSAYEGDILEDAIPITTFPYSTTGNTGYCYFNQYLVYNSPDIYYRLIPTAQTAQITVSLCGSTFDTFLSIIDPQGNVLSYNDDGPCGSASQITLSTAGIDTAFVIVEGWGSEQGDYMLTINTSSVGMDENDNTNLHVFPNPALNEISIEGFKQGTLSLMDVRGNLLAEWKNTNGQNIDLSSFQSGIYFLCILTENKHLQTTKITLKR